MDPKQLIQMIRTYTRQHPDLARAHHFCFDLRLSGNPIKYFMMGINPGEREELCDRFPGPTEETSEYDFLSQEGNESAVPWRKLCLEYLGTDHVSLTELFFWSSSNAGDHFIERFGEPIHRSRHLKFCCEMNRQLMQFHSPKAVVVTGVSVAEWAAPLYELEWKNDLPDGSHLLVRHCTDGVRPWAFIKHPAAFGFRSDQKKAIKEYLRDHILGCSGTGSP